MLVPRNAANFVVSSFVWYSVFWSYLLSSPKSSQVTLPYLLCCPHSKKKKKAIKFNVCHLFALGACLCTEHGGSMLCGRHTLKENWLPLLVVINYQLLHSWGRGLEGLCAYLSSQCWNSVLLELVQELSMLSQPLRSCVPLPCCVWKTLVPSSHLPLHLRGHCRRGGGEMRRNRVVETGFLKSLLKSVV